MSAISQGFSAVAVLAFAAILVGAAPGLANAGDKIYPPGWNTPAKPTSQILHQRIAPAVPANNHLCAPTSRGKNFFNYTC